MQLNSIRGKNPKQRKVGRRQLKVRGNSPSHMQLIARTSGNVSLNSTVSHCCITINNSNKQQNYTAPAARSGKTWQAATHVDEVTKSCGTRTPEAVLHPPRASDMRGPVPDPRPPLGHSTRCFSAVCASVALFLFGIVSRPTPPSLPCPARASRITT